MAPARSNQPTHSDASTGFYFKVIGCGNEEEKRTIPDEDKALMPPGFLEVPLTEKQYVSFCCCGKVTLHDSKSGFDSAKSDAKKRHTKVVPTVIAVGTPVSSGVGGQNEVESGGKEATAEEQNLAIAGLTLENQTQKEKRAQRKEAKEHDLVLLGPGEEAKTYQYGGRIWTQTVRVAEPKWKPLLSPGSEWVDKLPDFFPRTNRIWTLQFEPKLLSVSGKELTCILMGNMSFDCVFEHPEEDPLRPIRLGWHCLKWNPDYEAVLLHTITNACHAT